MSLCSPTTASAPTGGHGPGGSCRFTGNCLSARPSSRPPNFPSPTSWAHGWNESGQRSTPGSPATPATRPHDRLDQRWLPHNAGKPRHPRLVAAVAGGEPEIPPCTPLLRSEANTGARLTTAAHRSLVSATHSQHVCARAHTVAGSGAGRSCRSFSAQIFVEIGRTTPCVGAEASAWTRRRAVIDAGGSPGSSSRRAVSRIRRSYTGSGASTGPGSARPRISDRAVDAEHSSTISAAGGNLTRGGRRP